MDGKRFVFFFLFLFLVISTYMRFQLLKQNRIPKGGAKICFLYHVLQ